MASGDVVKFVDGGHFCFEYMVVLDIYISTSVPCGGLSMVGSEVKLVVSESKLSGKRLVGSSIGALLDSR